MNTSAPGATIKLTAKERMHFLTESARLACGSMESRPKILLEAARETAVGDEMKALLNLLAGMQVTPFKADAWDDFADMARAATTLLDEMIDEATRFAEAERAGEGIFAD